MTLMTVCVKYTTKVQKSKELTPFIAITGRVNNLHYLLKPRTLYTTMNIKQTIRNLVLGALLVLPIASSSLLVESASAARCGGHDTAIISCDQNSSNPDDVEDTGLWGLLILTINILIAGVGVLAVAGFVYGGYLYMTSGGSPEQVKKARVVFTNVVIGVVAFGGMFALLNFIVPGGVFN